MRKDILKILAIFIIGMGGGIFADQILWPYFVERPLFYQYSLEKTPVSVIEIKETVIQENLALRNAVEKVEKAVIAVRTETAGGKVIEGSGLIVSSDGLIVTLASLVPVGSKFSFFVEGRTVSYQIIKRDLQNDLALIKVEERNLFTLGFANLGRMKLGERVFLLGKVFEQEETKSVVNEGIVRSFDQSSIETNVFEKASLSGSPLFDIEGNILGLNTIDREGRVVAIPNSLIRTFAGF